MMKSSTVVRSAAAASGSSAGRVVAMPSRTACRSQRVQQRAVSESATDASSARADAAAAPLRRQALLALLAGAVAPLAASSTPAYALVKATVCADQDTGEEADECRARVLARDAGSQEDYARFEGRTARTASGVPVSAMGDEYVAATAALADKVEAYLGSDPYDKARGPLIKAVKADAQAWVTKYARGGSVRKQSARRFYVAVDAVLGHLASNGLAPFPSSKAKVVRATLDEALQLLAEGK